MHPLMTYVPSGRIHPAGLFGLPLLTALGSSVLAYYYALKFGDVSRVAPVVAAFPVVAMLLAFAVLGEQITATKVIAAVLITAGVVLLR